MKAKIQIAQKKINGSLRLAGSKSISNRLLILQALSGERIALGNLSDSEDTKVLQKALNSNTETVDIGIAGTAMRFLTAYYAVQKSTVVLTGAERMKQRPIKELVKALRSLGAEIEYLEKEGYPPLKISGNKLKGGHVKIKANVSSQFISALLMVAPYLDKGLDLELEGEILSKPYILMTLSLMKQQGVEAFWNENIIKVNPGKYQVKTKEVESDWSSISYLYELVALSDEGEIQVFSVDENSVQGDKKVMEIFQEFGVESDINDRVLTLKKTPQFKLPNSLDFDCADTPDLAQTIAATACGLGISVNITGLSNLPLKETNRLEALKNELEKCGTHVQIINNKALEIIPTTFLTNKELSFETYGDHRMALCLAPLALKSKSITVDDAVVVNKSYKSYWEDLKRLAFDIHLFE